MERPYRMLAITCALCLPLSCMSVTHAEPQPRLVLQITVDQLRGDLPTRHYDQFREGGFRYLWETGTVYANAHHAHANNETVVGHATLATGAHPADHGMIANIWFDRTAQQLTYNIEDPRYRLLTAGADVNDATEIDHPNEPRAAKADPPRLYWSTHLVTSSRFIREGARKYSAYRSRIAARSPWRDMPERRSGSPKRVENS